MKRNGRSRKTLGLALGGGGARGLAHLGVLKVFVREGIPIDLIIGTSIGALVGGAFAAGQTVEELEQRVYDFIASPLFQESRLRVLAQRYSARPKELTHRLQMFFKQNYLYAQALTRSGIVEDEEFKAMVDWFVPDIQLEETVIPFATVATDLNTGERVTLTSGPLRKAILASCAVPGAISPVAWDGRQLSDGGIICLVPATSVREMGADFVVSVAVELDICTVKEYSNALEVFVRAGDIQNFHLCRAVLKESDIVIRPHVGTVRWPEFDRGPELIPEGERATMEVLDQIKSGLPRQVSSFTFSGILRAVRERVAMTKETEFRKQ